MTSITSITDLTNLLPKCKGKEFADIVSSMKLDPRETKPFQFWESDNYTRNCVCHNEEFELILLCWEPGHITPIHAHGGEECWVYMVEGELFEERFRHDEGKNLVACAEWKMASYNTSYMEDDMGFHRLSNRTKERAMSLHLYVNPISQCSVYNEEREIFEQRDLHYYSVNGIKQKSVSV